MPHYLTELSTLKQRQKMRLPYNNRFILLTIVDDEVYAIQDKCPHMGSTLSNGILEGTTITCKDHGLSISVISGEVVDNQKADFLKLDEFSRSVRKFKTLVKDGKVYLDY